MIIFYYYRFNPDYRFDMFKEIQLLPGQFVVINEFYFKDVGYYMFRIVAKSPVDEASESILLNVLDAPCFPPKVMSHYVRNSSLKTLSQAD